MGKRNRKNKNQPEKTNIIDANARLQKRNDLINGAVLNDTYQNVLARLGAGMPNVQESAQYVLTRTTRNRQQLDALYRNSWLVRKIIDMIPEDMLKNWIRWEGEMEPDDIKQIEKTVRLSRLKRDLLRGMRWGRLYGGAVGIMMIEGQDDLDEPLDLDAIMPGDFKGLHIIDRWSGVDPGITIVDDITSAEFGLPDYYRVRVEDKFVGSGESVVVHHSRLLRFTGDDLPFYEEIAEQQWGASKVESLLDDLKRRDSTAANIAGLIFMANLRILKMEDLGQALAGTGKQNQANFYNTIQAQNSMMSNFGLQVLSKDDEFQTIQLSNFAGINDVYESFMLDLSGATGIPVTKLFGRAPAGMNATGESDMRNYYDLLEKEQERELSPLLDKLQPVLLMSTFGELPDLEYEYEPVSTPEQSEIADLVEKKTNSVLAVHDRGIITDRTALQELKALAEGTGMFTNITDEDLEKASDDLSADELADFPGVNPDGNKNADPVGPENVT